jgi:L-alanine-DL-glutamate epimerase-like enolase superfamily enzyme
LPNSGPAAATPHDGFFPLPKGPGLGVEINENELQGKQIS